LVSGHFVQPHYGSDKQLHSCVQRLRVCTVCVRYRQRQPWCLNVVFNENLMHLTKYIDPCATRKMLENSHYLVPAIGQVGQGWALGARHLPGRDANAPYKHEFEVERIFGFLSADRSISLFGEISSCLQLPTKLAYADL